MSEHLNKTMKKIITILAVLAFISPALASAAPFIVDQGGTGAQTLPAGQLLVGNGKSPISATSSPTVDSINTSSTTATSTFSGNAYIKGNLRVDGNFYAPVSLVSSGNATINGVLTVTGVTQFADGAVGTPSVTFTADTNTGMYRGGNDILRFVTAGADRLTINASGNVGIGSTSPFSKLDIDQTSSTLPAFVVKRPRTTSTAASAFSLYDQTGTQSVAFSTWDGGGSVNGGSYGALMFGADCNSASCRFGEIAPRDESSKTRVGGIIFEQGTAADSGRMLFYGGVGGAFTEGLRVSQTGLISVKKGSDATYPLEVTGAIRASGLIDASYFVATTTTATSTFAGAVGIGTTGPTQKLEVNGGIRQNTATSKPTCDSTVRGTTWFFQGGAGVKDTYEVCAKDAGDAYAWRTIY
jgi:hypothetical protein